MKRPKPNSTGYYIEEVISYGAEQEAAGDLKNGYPPIMAEMLLAILISVRAIRIALLLQAGAVLALVIKLMLIL